MNKFKMIIVILATYTAPILTANAQQQISKAIKTVTISGESGYESAACSSGTALRQARANASYSAHHRCGARAELLVWTELQCTDVNEYSYAKVEGVFACTYEISHFGECYVDEIQSDCYNGGKWLGGGHDGPIYRKACLCRVKDS